MSWLNAGAVFFALLAAVLIMVKEFSPNLVQEIQFEDLNPNIQKWFNRGKMIDVNGYNMFAIDEGMLYQKTS